MYILGGPLVDDILKRKSWVKYLQIATLECRKRDPCFGHPRAVRTRGLLSFVSWFILLHNLGFRRLAESDSSKPRNWMLCLQHYVDPFLWASLPPLRRCVPGLCACLLTAYRERKPSRESPSADEMRWDDTLLTGFHLCSFSLWSEAFSFLMRFFSLLEMQRFLTSLEQIGSPGGKAGLFDASPLHPDSLWPPVQ